MFFNVFYCYYYLTTGKTHLPVTSGIGTYINPLFITSLCVIETLYAFIIPNTYTRISFNV